MRALNVYLKKDPVPLRDHFDVLPARLGDWESTGDGEKLTAEMLETLGTDIYLNRRYVRGGGIGGAWISLHLAYYTGMIDAVPHVPDRCLVAAGLNIQTLPQDYPLTLAKEGWTADRDVIDPRTGAPYEKALVVDAITRAPITVHLPGGPFGLRVTEFSAKDAPDRRIYAGYFFIANGRIAVTPEEVKLLAFLPSERAAYYCKVQYLTFGDREFTPEDFVAQCSEFTEVLLPELMRCLPDWPEIQARQARAQE